MMNAKRQWVMPHHLAINPEWAVVGTCTSSPVEVVLAADHAAALTALQAQVEQLKKQVEWPTLVAPPKYENPAEGWQDPKLVDMRVIWKIAREAGYAVGVHGSLKRDMDLIAVPWTDEAVGNAELIDRLCAGLPAKRIDGPERKPHGRYAATLQLDGYYKHIDLSIMPRSDALAARLREIEAQVEQDHVVMKSFQDKQIESTKEYVALKERLREIEGALRDCLIFLIRKPDERFAFSLCRVCDQSWWDDKERHNLDCIVQHAQHALGGPTE